MNVIVQSRTLVVTEALRRFVERQAQKLVRRGQAIAQVHVFLDVIARKKNDQRAATAKFLIDLPGKNIVVQEKANDLYLAISAAAKNTLFQLDRSKDRRRTAQLGLGFS